MIHAHNLPSGMNNWLAMVVSTHAFMTLAVTPNLNSTFAHCNGVWTLIPNSNLKFRNLSRSTHRKIYWYLGQVLILSVWQLFFRSAGTNCEKEKAPYVNVEGVRNTGWERLCKKNILLACLEQEVGDSNGFFNFYDTAGNQTRCVRWYIHEITWTARRQNAPQVFPLKT